VTQQLIEFWHNRLSFCCDRQLTARKGHRTPEKSSGMNDWKVILNQPCSSAIVGHG
jgi:hypothetical protein